MRPPATSSSAPPRTTTTSRSRSRSSRSSHPQRRQLLRRDPGHLGLEPGPRRVRQRQREQLNLTVSQQYGTAGGTSYPTLVRPPHGPEYHRRRRDALVGAGALPGPDPAGERAVQLVRPGALRLQHQRARRLTSPHDGPEPDASRPPTAATPRSSRPARSSTRRNPPFPGEPATSTNLSQDLPELLRHLVGHAQRRGRRRADGAARPQPHAGRDPRRLDRRGRQTSR